MHVQFYTNPWCNWQKVIKTPDELTLKLLFKLICLCNCNVVSQVRGRDGSRDGYGTTRASRGRHVPTARATTPATDAQPRSQRHQLRSLPQVHIQTHTI